MKYNYPIKYAVMPIIEQVGWTHGLNELERKYDITCYIVSRCYLISDKTKYLESGEATKVYEVVFSYQKNEYNKWEKTLPSYSYINDNCTNSYLVQGVFDTYQDALEVATEKNDELRDNSWKYLPSSENIDEEISKKITEFDKKLSEYKLIEQEILTNTHDLEKTKIKTLDDLIINKEGKTFISRSNLYQNLNLYSYSNYLVYNVSVDEYSEFVSSYNRNTDYDLKEVFKSRIPILYHTSGDDNILLIDESGNVLYYINKWNQLRDNEDIPQIDLDSDEDLNVFFTTETLDDIKASFKVYEDIDPSTLTDKTLKKSLSNNN